ncbi:MAG: GNAT family N-acetyltransferase [Verrucomicrobiota bacterium]|nr:GNAT family N-acetyltransferase [Verrucomicrobiota bacterium]
MTNITIRRLSADDSESVSALLLESSETYTQYFTPFDFDIDSVRAALSKVEKDCFFALEAATPRSIGLAGFYMLRGLDEGFAEPMYGVFVAEKFQGLGLCRLTMFHAETVCRLNRLPGLLLKVKEGNSRARKIYESFGFQFIRRDARSGDAVLAKYYTCPPAA